MLDFEGNNLKNIDQLYYLKKCEKLTHLNLKYNPVAMGKYEQTVDKDKSENENDKIKEYYKKIRDSVPLIEELDDEIVTPDFFDKKI